MVWFFKKKKEVEVKITPANLYVTGMRLLFGSPFGIGIDKVRGGKRMKKVYNGRRSKGLYYVGEMPRSIKITHPAPRDLILTVFYGLRFTKSYTKCMVAYVEFKKDLIKPLERKVRIKEDVFVPGKRMYNLLANREGLSALVHDGQVLDALPRNRLGMPIPPTKEMLYVCYDPTLSKGYLFYITNLKRVGKHV